MADIILAPSSEEVPLAGMLAEMLRANLSNPKKVKTFNSLKTRVYLFAEDAEAEVTLDFDKGTLTVYGGKEGKPNISITTDSTTLLNLANIKIVMGLPFYFDKVGLDIVFKLLSRKLKIKGLITHVVALTKVTKFMSLK